MIYIYITVFFKAQTPTELFQGATIKKKIANRVPEL